MVLPTDEGALSRTPYSRPFRPHDLTDWKKWEPGEIRYQTKSISETVQVRFAPGNSDVAVDIQNQHVYLKRYSEDKPDGYWSRFNNLYAAYRSLVYQRRNYGRELPDILEMIEGLRQDNAEVVKIRKAKLKTPWAHDLRKRIAKKREKLLGVKSQSKRRALKYLTFVVQAHLSPDKNPDEFFGIDSLNRANGGPPGADTAASTRALGERVYIIDIRNAQGAENEAYLIELIFAFERNIEEAVTIAEELLKWSGDCVLDSEQGYERTQYYRFNDLHALLERLWITPYDGAQYFAMKEVSEIRAILEDPKGKYRRSAIAYEEWQEVEETLHPLYNSLLLLRVRAYLEMLLIPLELGSRSELTGAERDQVGQELLNKLIPKVLVIDDRKFKKPRVTYVAQQLMAAHQKVRLYAATDFAEARTIIKGLLSREDRKNRKI